MEKYYKQLDLFLCHPEYEDIHKANNIFHSACNNTTQFIENVMTSEILVENIFPYFKFLNNILVVLRNVPLFERKKFE